MITKFSTSSPSGFTFSGEFTTGVPAWWVTIANNDYRLFDGDYIIQNDNGIPSAYYSSTQYSSDLVIANLIREAVGMELIRSIWSALLASSLTNSQKVGIANKIAVVIVMIQCGEIVAGRFLANTVTTDANFTAGIKTALLTLMDTSISKL